MLDLNKIFGMREQMLPQEGFWGFVLGNWLTIAIVIMVLGFVIDQVLYIVRYRPQDDIMRFLRRFGLNIREDASEGTDEPEEPDHPEDLPMQNPANVEIKDSDRPVIRRGGAKYMPHPQTEPIQAETGLQDMVDQDAPLVVRAPVRVAQPRPDEQETRRAKS